MHQAKLKALVLLLAYSGCACAMEIGEMQVDSHLAEPFRAMIAVNPADGESIDDSCVSLDASPSKDGLFQLKTARLDVLGSAGPRIVRIATVQKINEPIVSLKLKLQCGNVSIEKAFTAFLDPVSAPATAAASQPIRRIERKPVEKAPVEPRKFEGTLLTIRPNDTLSGIAHDFYPYSIMAQRRFMASVLRENPGLSPNHLEAGSTLRIPYIGPKAEKPQPAAKAEAARPSEAKPKAAKPPEIKPREAKPAFRLAIVSEGPKQEAAPGAKASAADELNRTETQLVAKADSQTVELLQLQSQIKTLEANLTDLKRRVAVADRMLAQTRSEKPASQWIWIALAVLILGAAGGSVWHLRKARKKELLLDKYLEPEPARASLAEHLDFFETDSKQDW